MALPTQVLAPTLNALTPASAPQFSPVTQIEILIDGVGFLPETRARVNGEDRATVYVSPTQIKVLLDGSDLVEVGNLSIDAVNPTRTSQAASNVSGFTVTEGDLSYTAPPLRVLLPLALHK